MIMGVALAVTHVAYPGYVEARFAELLESLEEEGAVRVESSRCLGKPSEKIQLAPIVRSWSWGRYPFPLSDSKFQSHISSAYWHGYWFNYCKLLKVDDEDLIAYWSIRENKWHVGNFHWVGRFRLVWRCACTTSRSPLAQGETFAIGTFASPSAFRHRTIEVTPSLFVGEDVSNRIPGNPHVERD